MPSTFLIPHSVDYYPQYIKTPNWGKAFFQRLMYLFLCF